MTDDYEDIKQFSRPQYEDIYPMPISNRAAQFAPFAALAGYDAAVDETARLTDSRIDLDEDEIGELNSNLNRLIDTLDKQPKIKVTYFVPDERKSGGKYIDKVGIVRIFDSYSNELVFTDGIRIAVADMYSLLIS
ncbi:MAG: hypothetical protein IJM38_05780 [Ruminococcus sp.]|nr:hypothetical protein [Ruminococcus sp.]